MVSQMAECTQEIALSFLKNDLKLAMGCPLCRALLPWHVLLTYVVPLKCTTYHQCDHDGQSIGYLLSGLYQDDGQTDGHPHHTTQEGC